LRRHARAPPPIRALSLHDALPISRRCAKSPLLCPATQAPQCRTAGARLVVLHERRGVARGSLVVASPEWFKKHDLARQELQAARSEEHTSELQSRFDLVCRLLLEK